MIRRFLGRVGGAVRAHYTPSSLLFSLCLALGMLLVLSAFAFAHFYGRDVIASLTYFSDDTTWSAVAADNCRLPVEGIGGHCFSDYTLTARYATQVNPWAFYLGHAFNYPAAGMIPHFFIAGFALLINAPRVGLIIFLIVLAAALVIPAVWASKGKSLAIRLVTIGVFGLLSVPALMTLDRGNNVGLVVPFLLAFLVSIRRQNYPITTASIVLATMVKPQFALLIVALVIARKWKQAFIAFGGILVTNVLAFLFWPQYFPATIIQSARNTIVYGASVSLADEYPSNVSFSKGLFLIERFVRGIFGLTTQPGRIEYVSGPAFAVLVIVALVLLGRRIPAHISAIILVTCASICIGTTWSYYLVFALPVAAVILRDPLEKQLDRYRWHGIFDGAGSDSVLTKVSIGLIVVATALTVSRILLPVTVTVPASARTDMLATSAEIVPIAWMLAIVIALVAWGARRIPAEVAAS